MATEQGHACTVRAPAAPWGGLDLSGQFPAQLVGVGLILDCEKPMRGGQFGLRRACRRTPLPLGAVLVGSQRLGAFREHESFVGH